MSCIKLYENFFNKRKEDSLYHLLLMYDDMVELTEILGEEMPSIEHYFKLLENSPVNNLHDFLHLFYNPTEKNFKKGQYTIEEHIEEYEVIFIERKFGKYFTNNRDRFGTLQQWYYYRYTGYIKIITHDDFYSYFENKNIKGTIFEDVYEIKKKYDETKNWQNVRDEIDTSVNKKVPNGILTERGKKLYLNLLKIIGKFKKIYNSAKSDEPLEYIRKHLTDRTTPRIDDLYDGYLGRIDEDTPLPEKNSHYYELLLSTYYTLYGYKLYGKKFLFAYLTIRKVNIYDQREKMDKFDTERLRIGIQDLENNKDILNSKYTVIEKNRVYYKYEL